MSHTAWIQFCLRTKLNLVIKKNKYIILYTSLPDSLCFKNYILDENTIGAINQKNNEKKEIRDQNNNCNGRNGSFHLIDNIL